MFFIFIYVFLFFCKGSILYFINTVPWAGVALWDSLQFLIQKNRYCNNSVLYCVVCTYDAFWVNLNCVGKTSWDAQLQLAVCQALPSCFMTSQKTLMGRRASLRVCGSIRQVQLYFGISSITALNFLVL